MRNILYLLLLISSSCIGQVRDYNIRIGPDKDPDSTYCLVTAVTGSNFAGRGQFKSLPQLATLLQPFLSGGGDNQMLINSQTGTTHTINLSDAGGDPNNGELILIEGAGIRLSTTGTATASELTISAVDTSVTNEIQGIDNVLSQGEALTANRLINLSGTPYDFRIGTGSADFLRISPTSSGTYEFGDVDNTYSGPRFYLGGSSTSYLYNGLADVVFGINKTNPAQALDVVGNGLFSGTLTASNLSGTNTGDKTNAFNEPFADDVEVDIDGNALTFTNADDIALESNDDVTLLSSSGDIFIPTLDALDGSETSYLVRGTGGKIYSKNISPADVTLGSGATELELTAATIFLTGHASGNTISAIYPGIYGQTITLIFWDALITITDTASGGGGDAIDLSAAFTSTAYDVLTLVYIGSSWVEVSRSVN